MNELVRFIQERLERHRKGMEFYERPNSDPEFAAQSHRTLRICERELEILLARYHSLHPDPSRETVSV